MILDVRSDVHGNILALNTLFWRLATFPSIRVSSPQPRLTSEFGMRSGVTTATNHQNGMFNRFLNIPFSLNVKPKSLKGIFKKSLSIYLIEN
jgi:hypothetical protein